MRYRLSAKTEGLLDLAEPVEVEHSGIKYEFLTEAGTGLSRIAVSTRVEPAAFATRMEAGGALGVKATLHMEADPAIQQRLVYALQELEAHLSFATGNSLRRIRWDEAEDERIAETDEDRALTAISITVSPRAYTQTRTMISPAFVKGIIENQDHYHELVVTKAFFREGMNEFTTFRYIQAYYQFFFVLEDLYIGGYSGTKQVLRRLATSEEFVCVTRWALENVVSDARHGANLQSFYSEHRCTPDVPGTHKLLLELRGTLHHYSGRSTQRHGTPLNQDDFESPAYLLMGMAASAIQLRQAALSPAVTPQS